MKNNLIFVSVFANISELEPFCIKLIAFFLNIAAYFVINAILFDEDYISNRYNEEGSTGFIYVLKNEFVKSVYASLASIVVTFLINYVSNSRKRFETMYTQNKKYSQNCKKVRTNSEVFDREMKILDRLPKLYLKKGKMVSY